MLLGCCFVGIVAITVADEVTYPSNVMCLTLSEKFPFHTVVIVVMNLVTSISLFRLAHQRSLKDIQKLVWVWSGLLQTFGLIYLGRRNFILMVKDGEFYYPFDKCISLTKFSGFQWA